MNFYDDFNPRTPGGVRLRFPININPMEVISIHAPRVGCDRVPYGIIIPDPKFQSTHPGWGATTMSASESMTCRISIHAPRVGCDYK